MTMKAILAGAAMLVVAGLPAAAEAQNAVTSATVNFRASPNGAKIAAIPHGTPVTVLAQSGNWCQTEWRGRIGWVYCRYVQAAVAHAPRVVPDPYYTHRGYPYLYGAPFVGFGLGFSDFDRGFRHRHHRRHRFDGHRFGFKGDRGRGRGGGRGGRGGRGGGGSSGSAGYLVD